MSTFPVKFSSASKCNITSKTFTEVTEYGMNTEVAKRGNPHKWRVEFETKKFWSDDIRELGAFIDGLGGRFGTFTLKCPLRFMSADNSFKVSSSVVAGLDSINVGGLPFNTVGALRAGDFITFANHTKAYKIKESTDSDNTGKATLKITPRLFANVTINEDVGEGVFTLRMTKDDSTLSLDANKGLTSVLIRAIEA